MNAMQYLKAERHWMHGSEWADGHIQGHVVTQGKAESYHHDPM